MKYFFTYIFLIFIQLSFGQSSDIKNLSVSYNEIFSVNSENYIHELAKDMDTAFFDRYKDEIIEYEKKDSVEGIKTGKILFAGSSSFRKWKNIEKDLFPFPVLNRGFGGSTMSELDYYFFRIVKPYKPSAIVIYEGDNDVLAPFLTPEVILKSFKIFTELAKQYLPGTKIFFVSIKPSPSRIKYLKKMQKTNSLILNFCNSDRTLYYIDITKPMFNAKGNIREDIFRKDRLHMNEKGYKIWAEIIKEALLKNI